jgi:hypothetical protein
MSHYFVSVSFESDIPLFSIFLFFMKHVVLAASNERKASNPIGVGSFISAAIGAKIADIRANNFDIPNAV